MTTLYFVDDVDQWADGALRDSLNFVGWKPELRRLMNVAEFVTHVSGLPPIERNSAAYFLDLVMPVHPPAAWWPAAAGPLAREKAGAALALWLIGEGVDMSRIAIWTVQPVTEHRKTREFLPSNLKWIDKGDVIELEKKLLALAKGA